MPTRATMHTPTLPIAAERLWRARATELFMSCERDVFGDDESLLTLYERFEDEPNTARYVVRTRTRTRMPYAARRALGSRAAAEVETLDEYETDAHPGTAPFLYESTWRSYSNHLNAENSRVEGVVRCAAVDGGTRLTMAMSCDVRASGVGGAIERAIVANVRARFEMYPKVVELYETRAREMQARAMMRARDAEAWSDDERASFHSAEDGDASDGETNKCDGGSNASRARVGERARGRETSLRACCVPLTKRRGATRA